MTTRTLSQIAADIRQHWTHPNYGAVPYLQAMGRINGGIDAKYGAEDARDIVAYFLSNATSWRGEHARRIKAELKQMAGIK
jgi:hypothetical protein